MFSEHKLDQTIFALTGLIALTFMAFLLRQRVMDEFKDRGHDDANYPNRPFQRGAISARTLIALGCFALAIEIGAVLTISLIAQSWQSVFAYLGVLAFSALTFFEFFASSWLEKHFTVYFASHQAIFVFFGIWGCSIYGQKNPAHALAGIIVLVAIMATVEVMRKFEIRRDAAGVVVADTYPAVWGRKQSIWFMALAMLTACLLIAPYKGWWFALLGLVTVLGGTGRARPTDKVIQIAVFAQFIGLGTLAFLS
ncbi:MAG: hypothetical protein RL196_1144 [Actinomycetota bacterium]